MNEFPGIKQCPICKEVEHNPNICLVCMYYGSWAETFDTPRWIEYHVADSIDVHLHDGTMYAGKNHEAQSA